MHWQPYLTVEDVEKINYIDTDVVVPPAIKMPIVDRITEDLTSEMRENMRLYRAKKGMDCTSFLRGRVAESAESQVEMGNIRHRGQSAWAIGTRICGARLPVQYLIGNFDERPEVIHKLDEFAQMMEERMLLDPEFVPDGGPGRPPGDLAREQVQVNYTSDFPPDVRDGECKHGGHKKNEKNKQLASEQKQKWEAWYRKYRRFNNDLGNFPARKGKSFRAFPVHFSTADVESIRTYLNESDEYREMIGWRNDDISYSLHCRVFPLLGGILSVWLVFGTQTEQHEGFFGHVEKSGSSGAGPQAAVTADDCGGDTGSGDDGGEGE